MTGHESVEEKAHRLLVEGRVQLHMVDADQAVATVNGDSGSWTVRRLRGAWSCACPCVGRCSHLEAVSLVLPDRLRIRQVPG